MKKESLNSALTCCPATRTVRIIGGRWKVIILYEIRAEKKRYSDLQRSLPGITPKMLTQQLRELEDDGIVHREVYREVPPKVEYSLTPLGESLRPVIQAITDWGSENAAGQVQEGTEAGNNELKHKH